MRMKRKISFYKDGYEWYADVPFIAKAHNLMVAGADRFLEDISQGRTRVTLEIVIDPSSEDIKHGDYYLIRTKHDFWGGTYDVYDRPRDLGCDSFNVPMTTLWLCNVTHFVCGCHPKRIGILSVR